MEGLGVYACEWVNLKGRKEVVLKGITSFFEWELCTRSIEYNGKKGIIKAF